MSTLLFIGPRYRKICDQLYLLPIVTPLCRTTRMPRRKRGTFAFFSAPVATEHFFFVTELWCPRVAKVQVTRAQTFGVKESPGQRARKATGESYASNLYSLPVCSK
jgi:hypothetical protein